MNLIAILFLASLATWVVCACLFLWRGHKINSAVQAKDIGQVDAVCLLALLGCSLVLSVTGSLLAYQ